jgi:predicted LPLAT superfamily acyltransferase
MSGAWLQQRERGSLGALRFMTWITRSLGYRAASLLLAPICLYFVAFAPLARAASREFLGRVYGRPATLGEVYRHFHAFAGTLLDRIEVLRGHGRDFEVRLHGGVALDAALAPRRGCLLLGSHLGSFEVLRVLGEVRSGLAINLVMHEGNAPHTSRWARALAPELAARIIAPGTPETLLRVRECLERGEVVAMLGDRVLDDGRAVHCAFLGAPARFPSGPLLAAAMLDVPVVTFFCVRRSARRYDLHFDLLVERIAAERAEREQTVARWVCVYAARLEAQARAAPDNWFNFYDFWHAG